MYVYMYIYIYTCSDLLCAGKQDWQLPAIKQDPNAPFGVDLAIPQAEFVHNSYFVLSTAGSFMRQEIRPSRKILCST